MSLNWISKFAASLRTSEEIVPVPDIAKLYASLMLEVAQADSDESTTEQEAIASRLGNHFDLEHHDSAALINAARDDLNSATGLYEFTRQLNERLSPADRISLVQSLWQVALADDHIDKYEEAAIRKIADLLYVAHGDFIQAKHRAQDKTEPA